MCGKDVGMAYSRAIGRNIDELQASEDSVRLDPIRVVAASVKVFGVEVKD
jgi:hypothetical protein